jgi:hypothetical protein
MIMYRSAAAFIWSSRRRRSRCWRFQQGLADSSVDLDDVSDIAEADEVVVFNSTDRDVDVSFADEETVDDKLALRDDGAFMPE